MKLYHLSIASNDILKTQNFYCKYFKFRKGFENGPDGFIMNDDGFVIVIVEESESYKLPDWFHFGFQLDNPEEVHSLYKKMSEDGVSFYQDLEVQSNIAGNTTTLFFCFDPNGLLIEVRA